MQDGLGSVRAVVDNSVGVLWSGSPAPFGEYFGETGTRQTNYGFTGEYTDPITELVHLRARDYNPALGVFTALDPFEGLLDRPMSLNGYSWVEGNVPNGAVGELLGLLNGYSYANGNPVNLIDRSGMIPERDKITNEDFEYTYSCDCGWIDWKHADPNVTAIEVLDFVKRAMLYLETNPGTSEVMIQGSDIQHEINVPGIGSQPTYDKFIVISSQMNRSNWLQVAMAIFRDIEYAHENSIWSHLGAISPTWTQFAEEDLTSNLIAFYRALDSNNWPKAEAMKTLSEVCRFPSNVQDSQNWSLRVYDEYGSFQQVGAWESPRLHTTAAITEYCGDCPRQWPSELRSIQPNYDVWEAYPRWYYNYKLRQKNLHVIRANSDVVSEWLNTC